MWLILVWAIFLNGGIDHNELVTLCRTDGNDDMVALRGSFNDMVTHDDE